MEEGDAHDDDEDDEEGTKDGENPSRFGSEAPDGRTPSSRVAAGDHHHADTAGGARLTDGLLQSGAPQGTVPEAG